ncbi:hypothetical protein ABT095_14720 [Kitasatospora sp. NPDC002227]|uniref:hypothetical protein n=1 Tax=Kitasatospora sp. NPDC002227 TaxID=3154773 RepID=UPI003324226F
MTISNALHAFLSYAAGVLGPIGAAALVMFGLLYVGVILPTVWSRSPYRRTAAHRTLTTLLDHLDIFLRILRRNPPR